MASWRNAPRAIGLPDEWLTQAPTATLAAAVAMIEAMIAGVPLVMNQGASGTVAPIANKPSDDTAAVVGEPSCSVSKPNTVRAENDTNRSSSSGSSVATRCAVSLANPVSL